MIYKMTNLIAKALDDADVEYDVNDSAMQSEVVVPLDIGGTPFRIKFISNSDQNDVTVRVPDILEDLTPEQRTRLLPVINDINGSDDRGLRFWINIIDDLVLGYDFPRSFPDPEKYVLDTIADIRALLDSVYPALKKAADDE